LALDGYGFVDTIRKRDGNGSFAWEQEMVVMLILVMIEMFGENKLLSVRIWPVSISFLDVEVKDA